MGYSVPMPRKPSNPLMSTSEFYRAVLAKLTISEQAIVHDVQENSGVPIDVLGSVLLQFACTELYHLAAQWLRTDTRETSQLAILGRSFLKETEFTLEQLALSLEAAGPSLSPVSESGEELPTSPPRKR